MCIRDRLRQGSSVIITSSVGARKGWPTTSIVSSCKAAVVHLARILSAELVGRGIRVNTLSPGPTDTAMFGRFAGEEQGNAVKNVLGTNNPSCLLYTSPSPRDRQKSR